MFLCASPLGASHVKLFILTGQSNALGNTGGSETDTSPGSDPSDTHVRFFWHNLVDATTSLGNSGGVFTTLQAQQGGYYSGNPTHWGPEIAFSRTLYRAGVRDFGVIKACRGGGGNTYWSKSANGHMYAHIIATVTAAVADLESKGDTYEIAGLLYLQGESDTSTEAALAGSRIDELANNLRVDLPHASSMHVVIGGIAAAGTTRDIVRTNQSAIADSNSTIDAFANLDLQPKLYDSLHFNKAAKITVGERFAQAFFSAGTVTRHYGRLVFIGDSITQGGNGDHPSYRYTVFKHLANQAVPIGIAEGYKFTGSVTGPYLKSTLTTPAVNGQTFENIHDGHYGWRASWINGRVALPAIRRTDNRGEGTIRNWTGQASPQAYDLDVLGTKVNYPDPQASGTGNTGGTYVPDTVSIMIGINDLADNNNSASQVIADIGTMIDQLRSANPAVRIHICRLLYTNQTAAMKTAVDAVNSQLSAMVDAKNIASSTSPVWIADPSTGFDPVTMTFDNIHPNTIGETYVGDRVAASLGLLVTPDAAASASTPPHTEKDSSTFNSHFEGNEIWNGTAYLNSWSRTGTLTESLPATSDLKLVNPGAGGAWIEGTQTGWNVSNNTSWTFETRVKFTTNANGFILWLGTDTQKILVEVYGNRTQDNGANTFNVAHNNLDGNFHTFRIAHDAPNAKYHVWRDGVRLTPTAGVAYDAAGTESRLIMGDYTSQTFGNLFDATIDYVRYDQTGAYLPLSADADSDGLTDAWEYQYFGSITSALPNNDEDGDGRTNLQEASAGSDPWQPDPPAKTLKIFILTGQSNSLGTVGNTDDTMRFPIPGTHAAEQEGAVPFFWDNRADGTVAGDAALGDSGGVWTKLAAQTGGYYAGNNDHWGPEIGFARMLWNSGYRDFAIIKASRGGGGNTYWLKGSADDHMYRHVIATVQNAVATLPAGFTGYEISGLLYVQGESNNTTEATEAGSRFSTLMTDLKTDLSNAQSMVGIFGEIAGSGTTRDTTRTNQLALADSRIDIGYAESIGLVIQNQDGLSVHYDAESQILLGERMASEAIAAGAFSTTPLPAWANVHAWYMADHGIALNASNAVARWADLHNGSAVRDLTRKVSGSTFNRDVTTESGEARKVMRFDGTNNIWANQTTEFGTLTGSRTVAVLCRVRSHNNGYLFDGSSSSGRTRAQIRSSKWQAGVGAAWDEADTDTADLTIGAWQQHVFTFANGATTTTVKHWVNGTLITTRTDATLGSLSGLIVGSNGGSPFTYMAVDIAEIAVYNTVLEEPDISVLKSRWDMRWGNSITSVPTIAASQIAANIPRFGWHEVIRVDIDSGITNATTLTHMQLETTSSSRAVTSRWALFAGNAAQTFSPSDTPLAVIDAPTSDSLSFVCNSELLDGVRSFHVAVQPMRNAPLDSVIDAKVTNLTLTGALSGVIVPSTPDPVGALTLALTPLFSDVRTSGEGGVNTYRIPGMVCDTSGVLHAVYDHRNTSSGDLPADIDVGYARSDDGGATWSTSKTILNFDSSVAGSSGNGVGDPCILHDPATNTLWVAALWSFGNHAYSGSRGGTDPSVSGQYVLTKSSDGGQTWSAPINITADVKDDTAWRLVFQGPGHGLVLRNGTLVFPSQRIDSTGIVQSCSVFSSDHGQTWDFGSAVPATTPTTNENTVCELDDGRLLFSMRTPSGSNGQRAWASYTPSTTGVPMRDGTWSDLIRLADVPDPVCQGSVFKWSSVHAGYPRERLIYAGPGSSSARSNLTLRLSADSGATWPVSRSVYAGSAAYSSVCVLPDNSIGILFEKDNYTKITFARVEQDWIYNPSLDSDGDGLPDAWETLEKSSDVTADDDGDGVSNLFEQLSGTNPRDPSSVMKAKPLQARLNGHIGFSWQAIPGRYYQIETSDDLQTWTPEMIYHAASANPEQDIPPTGKPRQFIRVKALP